MFKQDTQCTYNVTLWRVHLTIVTVETQKFICVFFQHYLTNGTIFRGKLLKIKSFGILYRFFSKTLLILRKIQQDIITNVHRTLCTRVGTLIVATIYLQLIQNRYMFRSFTVLQCSQQHCVQPVASDVEVVGYL